MDTNSSHYWTNALKIVLVGDTRVGKTWLLARAHELYATLRDDGCSFSHKPFDPTLTYSGTSFVTCITNVDTADLGNYQTNIWDTGGSGLFNFLRPLAYICADVFMLCFDLTSRESFDSLTERWLPELRKYQPKTPILMVGTKYDLLDGDVGYSSEHSIPSCKVKAVADREGCLYQETSALSDHLVADAFEKAVKLGHKKREEEGKRSQRLKVLKGGFDPTWIPPISSPPEIKIDPSTYITDFKRLLNSDINADVLFKFEDANQGVFAHAVILWLTPSIFKIILEDKIASNDYFEQFKELCEIYRVSNDSNTSREEFIVDLKAHPHIKTVIVLKKWISRETFVTILEFIYTGLAGISKDTEQEELKQLLFAAEKLQIHSLVEICKYFSKLAEPKKACSSHEKMQQQNNSENQLQPPSTPMHTVLQGFFLDKEEAVFSDVTFLVEDTLVYAHKAVLVARSPVFAALLSDNFRERFCNQVHLQGIDCISFLAVLEYLYTDACPSLETISTENVLILADQLLLSRLVQICEDHLHKSLQQVVPASSILDALTFSKLFNARQLTKWCLFYMALNYTRFRGITKEMDSFVKDDQSFFEEHRWPPREFLRVLEGYKLKTEKAAVRRRCCQKELRVPCTKCSVM